MFLFRNISIHPFLPLTCAAPHRGEGMRSTPQPFNKRPQRDWLRILSSDTRFKALAQRLRIDLTICADSDKLCHRWLSGPGFAKLRFGSVAYDLQHRAALWCLDQI